jgi:hypothetical protein
MNLLKAKINREIDNFLNESIFTCRMTTEQKIKHSILRGEL